MSILVNNGRVEYPCAPFDAHLNCARLQLSHLRLKQLDILRKSALGLTEGELLEHTGLSGTPSWTSVNPPPTVAQVRKGDIILSSTPWT